MDAYYLVITILDVFVLGIMCILTRSNDTLTPRQRRWFILSFAMIIGISILEALSLVVDQTPAEFRWLNILTNFVGFGLTPAVPIMLASVLEKHRSLKYAFGLVLAYLLFLAVSFPLRMVFYVDQNNYYTRGENFGIFVAVYTASILYLLVITLQVAAKYQCKSKSSVYPIVGFLILSTMIQVVFPQVHVTWLCVTLLSMLYFTYCNGMWQQLDGLTGLLNQKSYLNFTASISKSGTLIVLDVDDFKLVNDNYGHLVGDQCLEEIAACMKRVYSKVGFCYRIGGDEFCVLLDASADPKGCCATLMRELDARRKTMDVLPYVSVGTAPFAPDDDMLAVKAAADNNMYETKREQKAARQKAHKLLSDS